MNSSQRLPKGLPEFLEKVSNLSEKILHEKEEEEEEEEEEASESDEKKKKKSEQKQPRLIDSGVVKLHEYQLMGLAWLVSLYDQGRSRNYPHLLLVYSSALDLHTGRMQWYIRRRDGSRKDVTSHITTCVIILISILFDELLSDCQICHLAI